MSGIVRPSLNRLQSQQFNVTEKTLMSGLSFFIFVDIYTAPIGNFCYVTLIMSYIVIAPAVSLLMYNGCRFIPKHKDVTFFLSLFHQ